MLVSWETAQKEEKSEKCQERVRNVVGDHASKFVLHQCIPECAGALGCTVQSTLRGHPLRGHLLRDPQTPFAPSRPLLTLSFFLTSFGGVLRGNTIRGNRPERF